MNLLIKKLQTDYPELLLSNDAALLDWSNVKNIETLWPRLISDHLVLTVDYSVLCHQIRENILFVGNESNSIDDIESLEKKLREQVKAASLFAQLLERIYDAQHLDVPRELLRLRTHRKAYQKLLDPNNTEQFPPIDIGPSLIQKVRDLTFDSNFFRLFFIRTRRFLDMIHLAGLGSLSYGQFMAVINKYAMPIVIGLGCVFFLPRLFVNSSALYLNTFTTSFMSEEQCNLGWMNRFAAQMQRRWFHLGNDAVWISVGLTICFLLVGSLAPIAVYLTLAAFIYDVGLAILNVSIELYRLHRLKSQYIQMGNTPEIQSHLKHLDERMSFEASRVGVHLLSTIVIVCASTLALPVFAGMPIIPLIGAILMVLITALVVTAAVVFDHCRPKDHVDEMDMEKAVDRLSSKIGFFAVKKQPTFEDYTCSDDWSSDEIPLMDCV